jgi:hypothetical protein
MDINRMFALSYARTIAPDWTPPRLFEIATVFLRFLGADKDGMARRSALQQAMSDRDDRHPTTGMAQAIVVTATDYLTFLSPPPASGARRSVAAKVRSSAAAPSRSASAVRSAVSTSPPVALSSPSESSVACVATPTVDQRGGANNDAAPRSSHPLHTRVPARAHSIVRKGH